MSSEVNDGTDKVREIGVVMFYDERDTAKNYITDFRPNVVPADAEEPVDPKANTAPEPVIEEQEVQTAEKQDPPAVPAKKAVTSVPTPKSPANGKPSS